MPSARLPLILACQTMFSLMLPGHPIAEIPGAEPAVGEADVDRFRPSWSVGDRWIVETQTKALQEAAGTGASDSNPPLRWQFTVQGLVKVASQECFRVRIHCLHRRSRTLAETTLWVDRYAWGLVQLQTQLKVAGVLRTVTESYQFPGRQPTPVLGPLPALPIDFPLLLGGRTKSNQSFTYQAVPGPSGTKRVGDLGFAFDVRQDLDTQPPESSRKRLDADFAKSLEVRPMLQVKLKTIDRQVTQLWQAGLPWPAYTTDGATVARLVKWTPARHTD